MRHARVRRGVTAAVAALVIWVHAGTGRAQDEEPAAEPPPVAPSPPPPVAPPPVRPRRAVDGDAPRGPAHRGPRPGQAPAGMYTADDGEDRPIKNPLWGFLFELGIGGGGSDLVEVMLSDGSTQTLSAGDGVSFAIGVMCTPLWVGDSVGVGLTATAGYKYWSVGASNGDISIGRAPLTLALHVLPRLSPRWFLLGRGGLQKEVDVHISSSGAAAGIDASPEASLGGFGEAGFYRLSDTATQDWGWSLTFRYTKLTYVENGVSADGQSFMFFNTVYFNP